MTNTNKCLALAGNSTSRGARMVMGWRGQCAYADAAHRVHARVEDVIRTGKDTGLGRFL